jgi:hypothetical protein
LKQGSPEKGSPERFNPEAESERDLLPTGPKLMDARAFEKAHVFIKLEQEKS